MNRVELLEYMADEVLKRLDPLERERKRKSRKRLQKTA
jgi:hypothetical protein